MIGPDGVRCECYCCPLAAPATGGRGAEVGCGWRTTGRTDWARPDGTFDDAWSLWSSGSCSPEKTWFEIKCGILGGQKDVVLDIRGR